MKNKTILILGFVCLITTAKAQLLPNNDASDADQSTSDMVYCQPFEGW